MFDSFYFILSLILLAVAVIGTWYVVKVAKETQKQDEEAKRRLEAKNFSSQKKKELH